ncbi:MAG: HlyD family type I secretion periplasmic adaptor subunit [Rhodobacteraceae bacterium]|nr:HlyD family type I secretion periplasmic adaptor subunit [Paracoccaceae bacterium]
MTQNKWRTRRFVTLGMLAMLGLFGGLGYWSATSQIAGAIVTSGMIQVESNRQVVQHPTGGVVGEILVVDGDTVKAGDILIRFDDVQIRSEIDIIEGQLFELIGRQSRLKAERDALDEITFDQELIIAAKNPKFADIMPSQIRLFTARRLTLAEELAQMNERIVQIGNQIDGTQAQLSAQQEQIALMQTELADQQSLLEKGLVQAGNVSALRRAVADLIGNAGAMQATIAQNRGRIAEAEIEILRLKSQASEDAITALNDLQFSEIELRQRRLSLTETLARLDVRAPRSGVVLGMQVHAERSVVQAAQAILYIVPQDSPLIISVQIPTIDIDQIYVGQEVFLRFPAFDQRTTPEILGVVVKIAPDVVLNEQTGQSFYAAELRPAEGELEKLEGLQLLPGMPVESFIKTDDRTPLEYLLKPLTDYFNRAFRES